MISAYDAGTMYEKLLTELLVHGHETGPRGMKTLEVPNTHLQLFDLQENVITGSRGLNYRFMVAEWLWILHGMNAVHILTKYNARMQEFSDDGISLAGAYGPRWLTQLTYLINTLKVDPASRQAVACIWREGLGQSKDVPCTLSLQFLIRDDALNCVATMRSSDAWLGLPYDVFVFSRLTSYLAAILERPTGWLALNLGSSHLYEENWDQARAVLENGDTRCIRSPELRVPIPVMISHALTDPSKMMMDELLEEPWLRYAEALLAKSSTEALRCLSS